MSLTLGERQDRAVARVDALTPRVLADEVEHGERSAADLAVSFLRRKAV